MITVRHEYDGPRTLRSSVQIWVSRRLGLTLSVSDNGVVGIQMFGFTFNRFSVVTPMTVTDKHVTGSPMVLNDLQRYT